MMEDEDIKRAIRAAIQDKFTTNLKNIDSKERRLVKDLGDEIGYGRLMQLAEQIWDDITGNRGHSHSVGCATVFLVPCPCIEKKFLGYHCEICCGSQRITKGVLELVNKKEKKND